MQSPKELPSGIQCEMNSKMSVTYCTISHESFRIKKENKRKIRANCNCYRNCNFIRSNPKALKLFPEMYIERVFSTWIENGSRTNVAPETIVTLLPSYFHHKSNVRYIHLQTHHFNEISICVLQCACVYNMCVFISHSGDVLFFNLITIFSLFL